MRSLFILFLICFFNSSNAQLISDSILVDGHYRSFHYNKPPADVKNGSLIFLLHGSGGSGKQMMNNTRKLEELSAKENFLVIYPDGYLRYWNECRKMSNAVANTENVNENAFFEKMIGYFKKKFKIDQEKVFAAGFSGGGHMAYKLALTMPGTVKAVAAVVANMPDSGYSDCSEAHVAVPVLIINGTLDKTNPYNGGEMFVNNTSFGKVKSTEQSFGYWAKLAGYVSEPTKELLPDIDSSDHKTIESYSFKAGQKPEVRLLKIIGGGHDYPGDIDVYIYAWDFFKRQF